MKRMKRVRIILLIASIPSTILPPSTTLAGIFGEKKGPADGPITLQQAAAYVDEIDRRLFSEGTIGVKTPGVWGQNRLTKYRAEFEGQMSGQLDKFQLILQAAQARTDIATLTSATSLGATVAAVQSKGAPAAKKSPAVSTTVVAPSAATATPATPAASGDPGNPDFTGLATQLKAVSDRLDALKTGTLSLPTGINTFVSKAGTTGVGIEPTVQLDEQADYINHLHQLRLLNDGDDLTDMAGYGLYLLRMPVSLMPGPDSRKGKGAIVTVEARHDLTDDLLPNTYRDVAILDLTYALTQIVNEQIHQNIYDDCQKRTAAASPPGSPPAAKKALAQPPTKPHQGDPSKNIVGPNATLLEDLQIILGPIDAPTAGVHDAPPPNTGSAFAPAQASSRPNDPARSVPRISPPAPPASPILARAKPATRGAIAKRDQVIKTGMTAPAVAAPTPPDTDRFKLLVNSMVQSQRDPFRHDPSTMSLFQASLIDAYRYMRRNAPRVHLFQVPKIEELGELLLRRDYDRLKIAREQFLHELYCFRNGLPFDSVQAWEGKIEPSDVLAFTLLLQFVLVEQQLKQDIRYMAQRRGCNCGDVEGLCFYEFEPSPEARNAFKDYVACKWPLHIYSVDPVVDQQNVLDAFSRRTELQLALAVAVSTGQFNIKNASTFARQLDLDLQTVGLNRTAVGFGAGDTTFGWMFYPRVQTPQPVSNFRSFTNLMTGTGQGINSDLRSRRIEPGQRECIALMVTPNFIPQIKVSTVANWFDATGHHAKQRLSNKEMLESSRMLQQAKAAVARACDSRQYRASDFTVLNQRIKQLEALLPTQDTRVDLPDESDLLGSELFSSNAAGLNPALLAWYGEPIHEGTAGSIFLQGRGFSVSETQVIVGGIPLQQGPQFRLISRNIMQVIVPETAQAVPVLLDQDPGAAATGDDNAAGGASASSQMDMGTGMPGAGKPAGGDTPQATPPAVATLKVPGLPAVEARGGVAEVQVGANQRARAQLDPTLNSDVNITVDDGQSSANVRGAKVDIQVGAIHAHAEGTPSTAPTAPKMAAPCGRAVIDVHIATPNGISNHLYVEVIPKAKPTVADKTPQNSVTTATTTTTVRGDTTTTSTRFETTPPGTVLPALTVLPMGTTWPPASVLAPGAVTGSPAGSLLPGLVGTSAPDAKPADASAASKLMLLAPTTPPTSNTPTPATTTPTVTPPASTPPAAPAPAVSTPPPATKSATGNQTAPAPGASSINSASPGSIDAGLEAVALVQDTAPGAGPAPTPASFRLPPLPPESARPSTTPKPPASKVATDASTARRIRPPFLRRIGLPDKD